MQFALKRFISAVFDGPMNWITIMAGPARTNRLLFLAEAGIILAWKVSGYIGADYFLLRFLGTPWGREAEPEAIKQTTEAAAD